MQVEVQTKENKHKSFRVRNLIDTGYRKLQRRRSNYFGPKGTGSAVIGSIYPIKINELELRFKYDMNYDDRVIFNEKVLKTVWSILKNCFQVKMIKLNDKLQPWNFIAWLYKTLSEKLNIVSDDNGEKPNVDLQEHKICVIEDVSDECFIEPHFLFADYLPVMRKKNKKAFKLTMDMFALVNRCLNIGLWWEGDHDYLEEIYEEDIENCIEGNDDEEDVKEKKEELSKFRKTKKLYCEKGLPFKYKMMIKSWPVDFERFVKDVEKYKPKLTHYQELKKLLLLTIELIRTNKSPLDYCIQVGDECEVIYMPEFLYFLWTDDDPFWDMIEWDMEGKCNSGFSIVPFRYIDSYYPDGRIESNRNNDFPELFIKWWEFARETQYFIYTFYHMLS